MPFAFTNTDDQSFLPLQKNAFLNGYYETESLWNELAGLLFDDVEHDKETFYLRNLAWISDYYEWKGTAYQEQPLIYTASETTMEFHLEWSLTKKDLRYGGADALERAAEKAGAKARTKFMRYWFATELLTNAVAAGVTGRVISGSKFYAASGDGGHYGYSGNVNSLTHNVTTTTAMTSAEWVTQLDKDQQAFGGRQDPRGNYMELEYDRILYIASPGHWKGFREAFAPTTVSTGGQNVWQGGGRTNVDLITLPNCTATKVFAFAIGSGTNKPFFWLHPSQWAELDVAVPKTSQEKAWFAHLDGKNGFGDPLVTNMTTLS